MTISNILSGLQSAGSIGGGLKKQFDSLKADLAIESFPSEKVDGRLKRPYFRIKNLGEHVAKNIEIKSSLKIQFEPCHDNLPYKIDSLAKDCCVDFTYNICEECNPKSIPLEITYSDGRPRRQKTSMIVKL